MIMKIVLLVTHTSFSAESPSLHVGQKQMGLVFFCNTLVTDFSHRNTRKQTQENSSKISTNIKR